MEIPSDIRSSYCRVCENRVMTDEGLDCSLSNSPIFDIDHCSEFIEDEEEVDRLLEVQRESELETSTSNFSKILYVIPLLAALLYWGHRFFQNQQLSDNYRITSAEVIKVEDGFNLPYFWVPETNVYFRYEVNSVEYRGAIEWVGNYNDNSSMIGEKFILLFSPSDPSNSELLVDSKVSKLITFPGNGVSRDSLKAYIRKNTLKK